MCSQCTSHIGFWLFKKKKKKKKRKQATKQVSRRCNVTLRLASPFPVHRTFCRIFKGFAWKRVYLYGKPKRICTFWVPFFFFLETSFELCLSAVQQGYITGILLLFCLALCDASYCFLPHEDLKWLMLIYTWHIYEFIHIYFCCFFAIN